VRPKTLLIYRQVIGKLTDTLGGVRLDKLTPAALAHTFARLRKEGHGSRPVQQAYIYGRACLGDAVRLRILGANPFERVTCPKHLGAVRRYWSVDETRRFVSTAQANGGQYGPLLMFLLGTGLRAGEALGLTWADVDTAEGTVCVRRALTYLGAMPTLSDTKTVAGRRTLVLSELARWALDRLPRPLDQHAAVFTSGVGTTPGMGNPDRAMRSLCDRAGVPRLSPHGLRHVHAALLAAEGVDPHSLRRRLGHTRVSTTLDLYSYAIRADMASASAFNDVMGKTSRRRSAE
jgi:integrase